jgi:hypothetical protein
MKHKYTLITDKTEKVGDLVIKPFNEGKIGDLISTGSFDKTTNLEIFFEIDSLHKFGGQDIVAHDLNESWHVAPAFSTQECRFIEMKKRKKL